MGDTDRRAFLTGLAAAAVTVPVWPLPTTGGALDIFALLEAGYRGRVADIHAQIMYEFVVFGTVMVETCDGYPFLRVVDPAEVQVETGRAAETALPRRTVNPLPLRTEGSNPSPPTNVSRET